MVDGKCGGGATLGTIVIFPAYLSIFDEVLKKSVIIHLKFSRLNQLQKEDIKMSPNVTKFNNVTIHFFIKLTSLFFQY